MNSHLVPVEVGVKRRTDERVQLNRFAFDQNRFERLDAKTVQRWRTVQHHWVFADHLIKDIPHLWTFFFDQFLGLLDCGRQAFGLKP